MTTTRHDVIPVDPARVDRIPPEDLNACTGCGGAGTVLVGAIFSDPASGMELECRECGGTGERRPS